MKSHPKSRLAIHSTLFFALIIVLSGSLSCGSKLVQCNWAPKPVVVDAVGADWLETPATPIDDDDISLKLANDDKFIYIFLRHRNDSWARQIRNTGLKIWLSGIDKRTDWAVRYHGGPEMKPPEDARGDRDSENSPGDRMNDLRRRAGENANKLFVIDRFQDETTEIPLDGSAGPSAAFSETEGFYNYELGVPLDKIDDMQGPRGLIGSELIYVGAVLGGMPEGVKKDIEGMQQGTGHGGMGMPGGMGHDGPPGGFKRRPPDMESKEIWVKMKLASSENSDIQKRQ
jgi:hypothetical protein